MNSGGMLIDSSDSFGDENEGGGVPYQHDMLSWEEAVVSDADECEENEDGVLILPSHEASVVEDEQESSSLSVPDSVPSDVHSFQPSTDTRMRVQQVPLTVIRNHPSQADDSDDEPDLLSDSAPSRVNVYATVLVRGETRAKSSPRVSVGAQVVAVVAMMFLMASTAYLVHDRRQLQARVRQEAEFHQEQIQRLRDIHEAELAAALERERLANEQKSTSPPKPRFFWEIGNDQESPLVDNCWAQVQLRECSLDAATNVKYHVTSMAQSALETTKGLYTQVKNEVSSVEDWWNDASAKIKDKARQQQQYWYGESSSPFSEPKPTDNDEKRKSQNDDNEESSSSENEEKDNNKVDKFTKLGKAVLTTVAVGAVATVLAAGFEAFFSDTNRDDEAGDYTHTVPDL